MPPIPYKLKKLKELKQVKTNVRKNFTPAKKIPRFFCPQCGAIHWFNSISGCHAKCGHMEDLIPEDLYKKGQR